MSTPLTPSRRTLAALLLAPVVAALALWAFAWPAARIAPHDLPLGIAGPTAAADRLQQGFTETEGAFEVHRYPDASSARTAIENREVYGALVASPQGVEVLTASAASPVVAQMLREAAISRAPAGTPPRVTDVVAAPAGDPRGSALGASLLPLALAGVAAGALVTLLQLRGARGVLVLTGASALVGIVAAALAHSWLGILGGNWWAVAATLALTVLAVGAAIAGLAALLGRAGLALGGLLMVLLGNPFSGATSAPQLLPEPVGFLGQLLPPGAGGSLLRSVSSFDGAGAGSAQLTLTLWAGLGLLAVLVAKGRQGQERHEGQEGHEEAEGIEKAPTETQPQPQARTQAQADLLPTRN
ncbi:ABC transporter permease [Streptomyces sp. NPDC051561]|uniref:ABC transporter permease n=1 Tax=Streptomyces sp. NPDC051561 TaxID=3365658 RepID=UPI0037AA307F